MAEIRGSAVVTLAPAIAAGVAMAPIAGVAEVALADGRAESLAMVAIVGAAIATLGGATAAGQIIVRVHHHGFAITPGPANRSGELVRPNAARIIVEKQMADCMLKQGDLEPELAVTLIGADGAPADLTTATSVRLRFASTAGAEFWVREVGIVDAPTGRVAYLWQPGDTERPGSFYAEIVVDWAGRPQTYPPSGYLVIVVEPRL